MSGSTVVVQRSGVVEPVNRVVVPAKIVVYWQQWQLVVLWERSVQGSRGCLMQSSGGVRGAVQGSRVAL